MLVHARKNIKKKEKQNHLQSTLQRQPPGTHEVPLPCLESPPASSSFLRSYLAGAVRGGKSQ